MITLINIIFFFAEELRSTMMMPPLGDFQFQPFDADEHVSTSKNIPANSNKNILSKADKTKYIY